MLLTLDVSQTRDRSSFHCLPTSCVTCTLQYFGINLVQGLSWSDSVFSVSLAETGFHM